jgi:hypothetical protein
LRAVAFSQSLAISVNFIGKIAPLLRHVEQQCLGINVVRLSCEANALRCVISILIPTRDIFRPIFDRSLANHR